MSSPRPTHRSRQRRDPPSCQMCRVKKLKCDRQRPCSNCKTRRLSCNYSRELPVTPMPVAADNYDSDLQAQNQALRARVLRLEKAVFGDGSAEDVAPRQAATDSLSTLSDQGRSHQSIIGAHRRPNNVGTCNVDAVSPNVSNEQLQACLRSADELAFDAEHQRKAEDISLPTHEVVAACLDLFEVHLDAIQAVMHLPSVREMVDKVYVAQSAGLPLSPGSVALILAICASMGAWELEWDFLFSDPSFAMKASSFITREAVSALEHARRSSQISVEAIQATILLTFQFCHFEGLSPHTRLLHSSAFTMARELGLHRVDASSEPSVSAQRDIVELEVARKVWWHLACTDWLFAYNGGPHEGVYSIHPQHMAVKLPRNINHDDLAIRDMAFTRSDKEPTIISFHLQRIKIAVVCREVMDEIWSSPVMPDPEKLDYEKIAALDAKFQEIISGLPPFLQLNAATYPLTDSPETWRMAVQRATINLMVHARRCKLHLPFLIHYKSDPRYKLSRDICLKSARKVFKVRERVEAEETPQGFMAFLNLGGQLSHVFYASFVLVMDLCVNKNSNNENQVAEVYDAIKVMQEAKTSSRIASTCYDSLMEILRKHQVNLPSLEMAVGKINSKGQQRILTDFHDDKFGHVPEHQSSSTTTYTDSDLDMINGVDASGDIWQDYLFNGSSLDPQNWEAVLNDLGMHIV
ncbi:hypothetical protein M409DRAFT_70865 [Zasmidium cellare ATCC 36951]|uniref:Zn(2)-C6 fungal-type domain-containing protein n=1 Tax=Zasmidium cellare ATCC 36951 TaxID=1080233 RepID=A0A6A6BXZ6_ZASCE|nr:uncharacterized protein M409DRAFT_70865 [Zasmidium cellare ATCC 36951]KAF2159684.1 hypothetical protein M409DRAFT_70865 [Zasmidium cellare ATCC 36951]